MLRMEMLVTIYATLTADYNGRGVQVTSIRGQMIHRAEEALIEVSPVTTIVQEALHDQEAIENSAIPNSDRLLEKLIQAIKDLDPGASVYFKEHQPDKNYEELQQALKEQDEALA